MPHRSDNGLETWQVAQCAEIVILLHVISIRVAKFHGLVQFRQRVICLAQSRQRASQVLLQVGVVRSQRGSVFHVGVGLFRQPAFLSSIAPLTMPFGKTTIG